jgi:cell division septal protein FtsQ
MAHKKNRRRERRHVLDVKLSSNQVRRRRTQLAVSSLLGVAVLTLLVYGLWRGGWWTLQEFVYRNEQLRIREFQVRTDGVIEPEVLRRWAGVTTNDNLFAIDLHPIKRQLEMQGMIRQAALERVLPGTPRLRVAERVPLARVRRLVNHADGRVRTLDFGLDETGHVMPLDQRIVRRETVRLWTRLPELAGVDHREVVPGFAITNQAARAALKFLAAFH